MNKSQPSQQQQQNPQIPLKPTNNNNSNLTYLAKMNNDNNNNKKNNRKIWDCGSTLYDSFELDSFRKQLDSAIITSSRTLSMPRLPSQHSRLPLSQPQLPAKKPSSKFSRTFKKLLRTVFRGSKHDKNKTTTPDDSGTASPDSWLFDSPVSYEDKSGEMIIDSGGKYYVVYDKTDMSGLSSIPEVNEVNVSPEFGSSLVRKTMSDRFTAAHALGIRCS